MFLYMHGFERECTKKSVANIFRTELAGDRSKRLKAESGLNIDKQ